MHIKAINLFRKKKKTFHNNFVKMKLTNVLHILKTNKKKPTCKMTTDSLCFNPHF